MDKKQYRIINVGKGPLNITPFNLNEVGTGLPPGEGTNLSATAFPELVMIHSSTGSGTMLFPATSTLAGLLLPSEKVILDYLKIVDLNQI